MDREAEEEAESGAGPVAVRNCQNRQALGGVLLDELRRCGEAVLAMIGERQLHRGPLPSRVGVLLVDDRAIAKLHGDYFDDPTPTDVITFPYGAEGEIVISVETARSQAEEFRSTFERELALYLVHGLLHLSGYEDASDAGRDEMARLQEELLGASAFRG